MVSVLLLVMVMVTTMYSVTESAINVDEFLGKLNEYRGKLKVNKMRKLTKDDTLATHSSCPSSVSFAFTLSNPSLMQVTFPIKDSTSSVSAADVETGIDKLKTDGDVATGKTFDTCSADHKNSPCKAYHILTYYGFDSMFAADSASCNSKTVIYAVFKTKGADFGTFDNTATANVATDRAQCTCLPFGTCEYTPATSGALTSFLCVARPEAVTSDGFIKDLNDWRGTIPKITRDTAMSADAKTAANAVCEQKLELNKNGKTAVWLLKDGFSTTTAEVGLKVLLTGLDAAGDKAKYTDCTTFACKAFLILRSNKIRKAEIAAQKCTGPNAAPKTIVVIELIPNVLPADLDKQFSLLAGLNLWRKGIVSTFADLTETAAIKTKAQTEVAKCGATPINLADREFAFVNEKLSFKLTTAAEMANELQLLVNAYKTAANGKDIQKDCSTLADEMKIKCEKFFIMIYAAYTNGAVVVKHDCSHAKTVFTFAAYRKAEHYTYVNQKGVVVERTTTATAIGSIGDSSTTESGNSTARNNASKVFAGFGLGASVLLMLSLLH